MRTSYLPATWDQQKLIIELGQPGAGPTMELAVEWDETGRPMRLVPKFTCGLYGDWEADFGVPWVFPLSVYDLVVS